MSDMAPLAEMRDDKGRWAPGYRQPTAKIIQPGEVRNPTGMSGAWQEARRLAREASPAAINVLIELMKTSPDDKVRAFCATAVWDRGVGKPRVVEDGGDLAVARIALMSPAQRLKLLEELHLRAKAVLEAEAAEDVEDAGGPCGPRSRHTRPPQ